MFKIIDRFIDSIEKSRVELLEFFFSLVSIVVLRTFFENLLEKRHKILYDISFYETLIDFFHIFISWATLYLLISLILHFATKKPLEKVLKVTLFLFPVIIIVPILDVTIFQSGTIHYLYSFDGFWHSFFHLFDPNAKIDFITSGVRVEIFVILLLSAYYLREVKISHRMLALLAIYTTVFIYGYLPAFYNYFFSTYSDILQSAVLPPYSDVALNLFLYTPIVLFLLVYFFRVYKNIFMNFLRIERFSIYIGIYIFSIISTLLSTLIQSDILNFYDLSKIFIGLLVLFFSFTFSTILNDLYDKNIDLISNKSRPFVVSIISEKEMSALLIITLFLLFGYALSINAVVAILMSFIVALSYLYSAKPFRLRRFFLTANFLLAFIAVCVYLLAVAILQGNDLYEYIDMRVVYSLGIIFFFAASIKDIKDKEGDSVEGVVTLTTLMGVKNSFKVLKIAMLFVFEIAAYILAVGVFWQLLILLVCLFAAIYCKNSEKYLMLIQFIGFLLYFGYILKLF
jgi:4-hydroxybenzoate polyprenyltransferase